MERSLFMSQLTDTILTGERQFPDVKISPDAQVKVADQTEALISEIKRGWPHHNSVSDEYEVSITDQVCSLLCIAAGRLTCLTP